MSTPLVSRPVARKHINPVRRPGGPSNAPLRRPAATNNGGGGRVGANAKGTDDGYLYVAGVKDPSKRMTEYRTEQDVCPVCHTDRQFNKNLRLLVSPCYHKMCESCIDRLFTLGPEPCPQCGKVLRKVNFAHQTFEDLKVEKEIAVRRRMAENFNKRREDFSSDVDYDNYLEDVEDLTFNLLNNVDIAATEARIAEFAHVNASLIANNQHKTAMEALSQAERDDVERRAREERIRMIEEAERVDREEDERVKAEIVDAIARGSDQTAKDIASQAARAKAARAAALASAVPPSLAALYKSLQGDDDQEVHTPLSPSYAGPYVPIPYSDPDEAEWAGWYELSDDYVDGRSGVIWVREDKEGKVRGGGWDLRQFWEMEIRSAVEALNMDVPH